MTGNRRSGKNGAPAGARRSGSGGERRKECTDMETSAQAGGGMEYVSSDEETGT